MPYLKGPLGVAFGEDQTRVDKGFRASARPFIAYDHVNENWVVIATPGGGGGDTAALTTTSIDGEAAALREAKALLDPDGTIPV